MNNQQIIERMAEALMVVSQARYAKEQNAAATQYSTEDMQLWIRSVLADPDEQLAVVILPHLIARLDGCANASNKEVRHG
ncbi:hypothetical protein P8631_11285 [Guyparkeria sp. 1SP6A2]|jgi:hypothetical protein|nr:hypothetical protein [Guyparkeria sp. 1SP6A2]